MTFADALVAALVASGMGIFLLSCTAIVGIAIYKTYKKWKGNDDDLP